MRLELLGPIRAWRDGVEAVLGPPKQRAVLGLLASRVNDVVSIDEIVDAVWGTAVPSTAINGVHTYVAGLRRTLEPGRSRRESGDLLVSTGGGYTLCLAPENVDVELFVRRHTEARRLSVAGDLAGAIDVFDAALGLWRAEAYANVPGPFAAMERVRLQELRLTAVEEWAGAMVTVGRHAEIVAPLSDTVAREPLREKLRWLLMLALYRCGRQGHALAVYRETRQLLQEELGIEPGVELHNLHSKILSGHPDLGTPPMAAPASAGRSVVEERARSVLRPAQLPPHARGLVGRARDLEQVRGTITRELARDGTTTTIAVVNGAAGVGKTTLALQLAHELSDRFSDGQLFVDLAGSTPNREPLSVPRALAFLLKSLGVDEERLPGDLDSRTALYRSLLHGRRVLVVLDDAVDAEQVRPLIPGGPACVLITSRTRQSGLVARDGAYRVVLKPLAPQESVALLTYLLGADRVAGQEQDVTRLSYLCGHLPLALRIAAEALVAEPAMRVAELARRYATRRRRLDYLAAPDDTATSVRAAFEASYHALPAEAARMFRLLGLYRGPVLTIPVAAALTGTTWASAGRQLDVLASRHLLEEAGRQLYHFPALVDLYAAECAEEETHPSRTAALARLAQNRTAPSESADARRAAPEASRLRPESLQTSRARLGTGS